MSPSLRKVVQPPRIRHKQSESNNSYSQIINKQNSFNCIDFKDLKGKANFSSLNSAFKSCLSQKQPSFEFKFEALNSGFDESRSVSDLSSELSAKSELDVDDFNNIELKEIGAKNEEQIKLTDNKQDKKLVKIRLPSNVRMLNLKNFPPNQSANAKRKYSIPLQRMKKARTTTLVMNLNLLEKNIQSIIDEKLKSMLDTCKTELIEPAMKHIRLNFGEDSVKDSDMMYLLVNMINKTKNQFSMKDELEDDSERVSDLMFDSCYAKNNNKYPIKHLCV